MTWQPISVADLRSLLAFELEQLTPPESRLWNRFAVEPTQVLCDRNFASAADYENEKVFVIARADDRVCIFDDVESEFGIGTLDHDGVLRSWDLVGGRLSWLLRHLPSGSQLDAV